MYLCIIGRVTVNFLITSEQGFMQDKVIAGFGGHMDVNCSASLQTVYKCA